MDYKIGGGSRLQPYDEDNGQYTDKELAEIAKKDMENIVMVVLFGLNYEHLKFHFPRKGIHSIEYCDYFVQYVKKNHLYGKPFMDDAKLANYLFKYRNADDKSKFMIEVLGFANDERGWALAKSSILSGLDYGTMEFSPLHWVDCLKVTINTTIFDYNGCKHNLVTVWEMQKDFNLRFITLIPGRN